MTKLESIEISKIDKVQNLKKRKEAVIHISDLHIGSTVSLCPKIVYRDDGGKYVPSKFQRNLLEDFEDFMDYSLEITDGMIRVLAIHGDTCDIDGKDRTWQLVARNPATIDQMVYDVLDPFIDAVDYVIWIRGTEAHVGPSAHREEQFSRNYDNTIWYDKKNKIASWWMFEGKIGGLVYNMAHHATMGNLKHTERNAANKIAYNVETYCLKERRPVANVATRGHVHRFSESGLNHETMAFTLPCWTGKTSYIYRIGKELDVPEIGGLVTYMGDDGEVVRHLKMYKPKENKKLWVLQT